jgi:hypothetical protein
MKRLSTFFRAARREPTFPLGFVPLDDAIASVQGNRVRRAFSAFVGKRRELREDSDAEPKRESQSINSPEILTSGDQPAPEPDMWLVLRRLLFEGALPSFILRDTGELESAPNDLWRESGTFELTESRKATIDRLEYQVRGKIVVSHVHLALLLESAEKVRRQEREARARHPGGAPAKFDVEEFLVLAFRMLFEGNPMPKDPATLRKRALDAYAAAGLPGGVPSEAWARKKISKLWKSLFGS